MPDYRLSDRIPVTPRGTVIGTCVMCEKVILTTDLPADEWLRSYVLKWRVHPTCYDFIGKKLDLEAK